MKILRNLVCLMAAILLCNIVCAEEPPKKPAPAWLKAHQADLQAQYANAEGNPKTGAMRGDVLFVFGNKVWQPGQTFKNGQDWLALLCNQAGCAFAPASLKTKKELWQGHYDDQATVGQVLSFSLQTPSKDTPIAWFKLNEHAPSWLKVGKITTYHSALNKIIRPKSKGTFEVQVNLPQGEKAVLVPLLDSSEDGYGALLQLRVFGKRQLLLNRLATCSGAETMENSPHYLQWAGDLDNDNKPDFLVSFIDADGFVQLYLSSKAQANQLVGLAGSYTSSPFGGECDGYGW